MGLTASCPPVAVRLFVCALLLACAGAPRVRAQASLLDPITRAQGSPSDYVFGLMQDRQGFLWLATDAGVARYDGRSFVTWTTADGLPHNYTYILHELPDGRIVVGTFKGAAVLEAGRFRKLEGVGESVQGIAHDAWGRLYLSTAHRVDVCEQARCRPLAPSRPTGLSVLHPRAEGGFSVLQRDSRVLHITPGPQKAAVQVRTVPLGDAGDLEVLLSEHLGLRALRPTPGAPTSPNYAVVDLRTGATLYTIFLERPRSVLAHTAGGALVGTQGGEVWEITRAGARQRAHRTDLDGYAVQAILRDYEGHLWLGLFGGGARQLLGGSYLERPVLHQGRNLSVQRLSRDADGTVWITTREGLFERRPGGQVRLYSLHQALGFAARTAQGTLYRTSGTGLFQQSASGRFGGVLNDGDWFSSLLLGPGDTLWAGTYGSGVRRVVGGREVAPPAPGGPSIVEALAPGADGAVWVLTRSEGAWRYHRGRWQNVRAGLPSAAVYSLLDDPDGTLWLGTDRGLVRQRHGQQRLFDDDGALRGQRLHALFRTGDTLWAVADRHLYTLAGDTLRAQPRLRLRPDDRVAVQGAVMLPEERRLIVGTSGGLVEVDLRAAEGALPPPRVAFLGLAGSTASPRDTVRLAAGVRSITLAFAPLTFGSGQDGRLQHRVGGEAWTAPATERTVALAGLGDGWHRVEVRAVNAEGRVSVQPVVVALYVPPPWWRTWPARLAGFVLLLTVVAAVVRSLSTRRLRARLRAFETEQRVQAERDRISRDLHDHVGAQLTGVLAGLELLGGTGSELRLLEALQGEVRDTMGALRTAIFTLQHPPHAFDELGRLLDRYVRDQARFRTVPALRCTVTGAYAPPLEPAAALHLFRIAQEALQNALRHAGATRVLVHLAGADDRFALTVEDDGAFRPPDGTGHGLATMQARADEIGAALAVEGRGTGTCVRVAWPGAALPPADIVQTGDGQAGTVAVP